MKELVLDISKYDEGINLAAWKALHGLWGVIIKAGGNEGGRYRDRLLETHYANAKAAGLHVGFYCYSTSTTTESAAEDARHTLSLIEGKDFDLPVYIDVEDAGQTVLGQRRLTDVILAFIRVIEDAGYRGGAYTSGSWWQNYVYADELRPYANWIAWWTGERPSAISDVGLWQFGSVRLSDGARFADDVPGCVDGNYCYIDYPAQSRKDEGGSAVPTKVEHVDVAERAALIHYDMVSDARNGYSQAPVRWGGDHPDGMKRVELPGGAVEYALGSYDCSSSVCLAWRLALIGTKYEGALDGATYTGDMREVFLASGLFYADRSPAKRGDVYLNDNVHTAMCQDGGLGDGPFGYDCLSHFRGNEWGGIYGGEVGDQTGDESCVAPFYEAWATTLHYNHKADYDIVHEEPAPKPTPEQHPGDKKNSVGIHYRAHCQRAGWLPAVRDGQTAGTEGYSARMEAIKISPPEGVTLDVMAHLQGVGDVWYRGVKNGERSGTESSDIDPIIGTVGESRRMEGVEIDVVDWPKKLKNKWLYYQLHLQGIGWTDPVRAGEYCGTRGQSRRAEAIRMWIA